jgi:Holliday junction resolvase RusA-like endonuclease
MSVTSSTGALVLSPKKLCRFEVMTVPRGWERAGALVRWKNGSPYVHFYVTPDETEYQADFAWAARAMHRGPPSLLPIAVTIQASTPIPPSWREREKAAARYGERMPTGKPDIDNIAKSIMDAMIGIIYGDDAQVVDLHTVKRYCDIAAVSVEAREFIMP